MCVPSAAATALDFDGEALHTRESLNRIAALDKRRRFDFP